MLDWPNGGKRRQDVPYVAGGILVASPHCLDTRSEFAGLEGRPAAISAAIYCFTAPAARSDTSFFWMIMNSTSVGRVAITEALITRFQ